MNKTFQRIFSIYAWVFFFCGLLFISAPNVVIDGVNYLGSMQSYFTPLDPIKHRFWLILCFSMMMMVAYASHEASKDFNDSMIRILILSKAISSLSYFVMLFLDQAAFGYLLGFIVDGSICLSIIYMYRQLK
jgi:hypothetical protein